MLEYPSWNRIARICLLLQLNCLVWSVRQVCGAILTPSCGTFGITQQHEDVWCKLRIRGGFFDGSSSGGGGGGGSSGTSKNVTVEDYVAAVEEKDAQHRSSSGSGSGRSSNSVCDNNNHGDSLDDEDGTDTSKSTETGEEQKNSPDSNNGGDPASGVSVKSHASKKSNAVGDPDGDDDDDDDDTDHTDDTTEEWEDLDDELEDFEPETQLQVEVEYVEDKDMDARHQVQTIETTTGSKATVGGGGVGVRLGQRLNSRRKTRNTKEWRSSPTATNTKKTALDYQHALNAWLPYVYFPPSKSAKAHLVENARLVDASSKARLDRRTLYSGLLLEWLHESTSYRKFLDPNTSQSLQAELSMASQPQWRQAFPRPSAIKLYEDDANKGCTLSMQETVAMALAHSLGSAMVILDDETILSIRKELSRLGYADEDMKPSALLKSLLDLAKKGKVNYKAGTSASIASCMQRDLKLGLDDPYDDHATSSCAEMTMWEEKWFENSGKDENEKEAKEEGATGKPLPLVIFLRSQAANSLLKSKSAVEAIMQECASSESMNLVVFGKGIDVTTESLPQDLNQETSADSKEISTRHMPGAAPWFGFSPQNQNASGQNDPEGSRRFNIFLARTVDANGVPGILGAIAPPQAGNLFPHMMAMQARERLQNQEDDSAVKAELEQWAELLQQQMQNSGSDSVTPPQFFNASLGTAFGENGENPLLPPPNAPPPPPEVLQQTLQQSMSELLDRLAQVNDDDNTRDSSSDLSPDVHKAFAQILRNDNLRQGIKDNLARAAPALSDPKCQGVMLSVYVPPPPHHMNRGKLPGPGNGKSQSNMGGWFQKILNNQDNTEEEQDESRRKSMRQKRVRTMAAAAAVTAAMNAQKTKDADKQENKSERNLAKLESLCRQITINSPTDPVRAKSWEAWIARECGAVTFRQNRRSLNRVLENRNLSLQQHTGTLGAGSSLRQMLSVRDISDEMDDVIKCAVELEAAKSQRLNESPEEMYKNEIDLDVDVTLSQLLIGDNGQVTSSQEEVISSSGVPSTNTATISIEKSNLKYLHPSSIETALSFASRISPSPSGGLTLMNAPASHRSKDEILSLAQDKHERALISQVVSPQDIGVTYDMIGGLTEVKELLRQSITYPLKFPHLYSEGIAREAVKGVLLFGPPGTGKTMLAKAVATEGGASFLSVDASSVENKWLGESEKNAKAVFTLARRLAPCVIFIDEVDSLLSSREGTSDDSAHGTLTSVKTTMMSEWDGLNSGTNGSGEAGSDRVVVIGSTNRPFDLDEAVLRRFPRRILVDLPDLETRTEILEVTLAENRLDPEVNMTMIAERLEGYTGSDIKEVCREAVVQISHEQAKLLDKGFSSNSRQDVTQGSLQRLRPVTVDDFEKALSKLKRSVSEKGRELARVWEWNDEYGEIKREKKNHLSHLMNMYL